MSEETNEVTQMIEEAFKRAQEETGDEPESPWTREIEWPIECTVGPGLEGAIACESKIGYVNGSKGRLIYRGYDIFDLAAHSTFEEVCYLLLHGDLPTEDEHEEFKEQMASYRPMPGVLRHMMSFPIENLNPMGGLRLGTALMRREYTNVEQEKSRPSPEDALSADEDSIPMETAPTGEKHAIYEFDSIEQQRKHRVENAEDNACSVESCYHLISGAATIAAAVYRIRQGKMPIDPDPELSHAANYIYMMTGRKPTPMEERVMDVSLILHADHGMNASTFAALVVASTLSDIYFSLGAGIAALNGPLHGGANEQVIYTLREIGGPENVDEWFREARDEGRKIPGFGHRVYKTFDPRGRILGPLAKHLSADGEAELLLETAKKLENAVLDEFGREKGIFPNVDFYSGLVYHSLGLAPEMFTPTFAVSRMAGWSARVLEYLKNNRIFRPRATYVGEFGKEYTPRNDRS
ncbi:MAG: citrate/2-methylcitrate synthase [Planctomycetota bacterium]